MEELQNMTERLRAQRPVNWEAMPDIALYMDQVVSYLPRQTLSGGDDRDTTMTSAMINNYIKDGLVPRAQGKRYGREHLAYLTVIALLKNVLSVRDMKLLLGALVKQGGEREFYDNFLKKLDEGLDQTAEGAMDRLDGADLAQAALTMAIASCGAKLVCEQLLCALRAQSGNEEEGKKKKEK